MSMELCSDDHEEICYSSGSYGRRGTCPVCAAKSEAAEIIKGKDAEIEALQTENAELERKLNEPLVHAICRAQNSQPV